LAVCLLPLFEEEEEDEDFLDEKGEANYFNESLPLDRRR
jgi:hypothetical protein